MIGKLISNYTYKFGRYLAQNRKKKWARTIGQNIKSLYYGYENHNYDFASNGEQFLIERLSENELNILFDVGANIGSWSKIANKYFPNARIHAFEIVPDTFEKLTKNVLDFSNIKPHCLGFGDEDKTISINYSRNASSLSGFYEVYHPDPDIVKIDAEVNRLDTFCLANGIDYIDLLKVDTEGMELKVLKGAEGLLKTGSIKVIQFEYGFACIDAGYLLRDVYEYLSQYNYKPGKLYPDYVDFRPYHRMMEDFIGPNFVAIHEDNKDLIKDLK